MTIKLHPQLARTSFDEAWFETLFQALDRLHDAVSDERACNISPVAPAEMIGWLEDVIYTAQEAIVEIRLNTVNTVNTDRSPDKTVTEAGYTG